MMKDDLSRRFMMNVCANGSVHIRDTKTNEPPVSGTLPVFSTDTREEAEKIRVFHCRLARDGSGLYFLNETPRSVEDLAAVSDMFRAQFGKMKARAA